MGTIPYHIVVLNDGPVAYWRFEESSGATAQDSSPSGNALDLSALTGITYGRGNPKDWPYKGLALAGTGSAATTTTGVAVGTSFSLEFWFRPIAGAGAETIIANTAGTQGLYYDLSLKQLSLFYAGNDHFFGVLVPGNLYHIVLSCQSGTTQLYINGKATGTPKTLFPGTTFTRVAGGGGGAQLKAYLLDELAIYPYALSATQIVTHYQAATTPPTYYNAVVGDQPSIYWRFNDSVAGSFADSAGTRTMTYSATPDVVLQQDNVALPPGQKGFKLQNITNSWSPSFTSFTLGTTGTVEWWMKMPGTPNSNTRFLTASAIQGIFLQNSRKLDLQIAGVSHLNNTPISVGQTHHIAVSIDGGTATFYVDGVADGTASGWTSSTIAASGFLAGVLHPLMDLVADLAVYPQALTAEVIAQHAQSYRYAWEAVDPPYGVVAQRLDNLVLNYVPPTADRQLAVLEMEFSGRGNGWTKVTDWLTETGISWHRGLPGNKFTDAVAEVGTMSFTLDNSETNSANKLGYYSPGHPNCRTGFDLNIGVRLRINNFARFTGTLDVAAPVTGRHNSRRVSCQAVDWMDTASRLTLQGIAVQVNQLGNVVFNAIVNSIDPMSQPLGTVVGTSPDTFPYTMDRIRDEQTNAQVEFHRLAISGLSKIWLDGSGFLHYEPRGVRASSTAPPADTFLEHWGMDARYDHTMVFNHSMVTIHPRLPSATDVVMYSLQQPIAIAVGQTINVLGPWTDPANPNVRVGAVSLVTLVSGTDYLANTAADGSGTNITANLTVTVGLSGNATAYTITLNTGSAGFITKLQQRGKPLYDYGATVLEWTDVPSITKYGEITLAVDMPYQADGVFAQTAAQFLVNGYRLPQYNIQKYGRFISLSDYVELARSLQRDISDYISITDEVLNLAGNFFINNITETVGDGWVRTEWMLSPPLDTTAVWILEVHGRSELATNLAGPYGSGSTTQLGYGL